MTKTEEIFKTTAPYNNPYQDFEIYPRWLFVCSAGLLRSATGANLYAKKGYNTRSAGSHTYALTPLSMNLICWADRIIFVNKENYAKALQTFEFDEGAVMTIKDKGTVLDIPDMHNYNAPELVAAFEQQLG
jgi:predicted protein tyrosine phosphatase